MGDRGARFQLAFQRSTVSLTRIVPAIEARPVKLWSTRVLGFRAIRSNGVAADLVMSADASLPGYAGVKAAACIHR